MVRRLLEGSDYSTIVNGAVLIIGLWLFEMWRLLEEIG